MSLLTACQKASRLLSLPVPASIVGASGTNEAMLFELANEEARDLARRHYWSALTSTKTFVSTATELQSGAIPTDFDRMIPDTFWNRSKRQRVAGPLNAQAWQQRQASISVGVREEWRRLSDGLHMLPVPAAGLTYAFDYIANTPVRASGGAAKTEFTVDTDTFALDEELLKLGLIWRFRQRKGLSYAEEMKSYELRVETGITSDLGSEAIAIGSGTAAESFSLIPEGDWPLT